MQAFAAASRGGVFIPAFVGQSDWAEDGQALQPRTEEILEAASEFLWSDDAAETLDQFAANHSAMFKDATATGEQRLEWTQAHLDFQQLFEHQLEHFIGAQEFSQAEFEEACQDCMAHAVGGAAASIVNSNYSKNGFDEPLFEFFTVLGAWYLIDRAAVFSGVGVKHVRFLPADDDRCGGGRGRGDLR